MEDDNRPKIVTIRRLVTRMNGLSRLSDDQAEDNMTPKEACERSVMYLLILKQELLFEEGTKRLSQFLSKSSTECSKVSLLTSIEIE